jgi:hypothetical protein
VCDATRAPEYNDRPEHHETPQDCAHHFFPNWKVIEWMW